MIYPYLPLSDHELLFSKTPNPTNNEVRFYGFSFLLIYWPGHRSTGTQRGAGGARFAFGTGYPRAVETI